MSRKRYRIRRTGGVSITKVKLRESHIKSTTIHRNNRKWYPLYETWNKIYNFKNLVESIERWDSYSRDEINNLKIVASLLEEINKNGNLNEPKQATDIICNQVLQDTVNVVGAYKIFCEADISEANGIRIAGVCDLLNECDRVSSNFKKLNSFYDVDNMVIETVKYWPVREAVYRICEATEELGFRDSKTKFPVLVENTLYAFNNIAQDFEIPVKTVIESAIDHCLINSKPEEFDSLCESILSSSQNSYFVDYAIVENYINYLKDIKNGKRDRVVNEALEIDEGLDEYYYIDSSRAVMEETLLDTAKDWMSKIKLAPEKAYNLAKEGIHSILVTSRLQDVKKNTHNALALAFYAVITAGAFTIGAIPGVLGAITSYLLSNEAHKMYLEDAIQEWRDHKYAVQHKLKSVSTNEQKSKLQAYLSSVDENIDILEAEWEKYRDRTASEIEDANDIKHKTFGPNKWSQDVSPSGKYSPSAFM